MVARPWKRGRTGRRYLLGHEKRLDFAEIYSDALSKLTGITRARLAEYLIQLALVGRIHR